jgi:hypothetical protein
MATKLDPLSYLNFWEEAEAQEFGLLVEVETEQDKRLLVVALYECRKLSDRFEELMIFQPGETEIFIAKKTYGDMP